MPARLSIPRAAAFLALTVGCGSLCAQVTYDIQAFAGTQRTLGDSGPAVRALLWGPRGVALDHAGNLLIADTENALIRRAPAAGGGAGAITTIAGNQYDVPGGDGDAATQALLAFPYRVTAGPSGEIYIADAAHHKVRRVAADGTITTVAGTGVPGYAGDGGAAAAAQLNSPRDIALDSHGNLYIVDSTNCRIRRVTPAGTIQTVVGTSYAGYLGDGGPASQAWLNYPLGIAIDAQDNIYIADTSNHRVRMVAAADGTISTLAGSGIASFGGDNQSSAFGQLNQPSGVAVDSAGRVYIADAGNQRIRRVTPGGNIVTIAGSGAIGFAGDGGAAVKAQLNTPRGVAVDAAGNVYIADTENHRIRLVTAASGAISTVAGSDPAAGDKGPALEARLFHPGGMAVDAAGNVFIADTLNHRVRRVSTGGVITTVAGTGVAGSAGDNGPASEAQLNQPNGLALDSGGNLYIADTLNHAIRRVTATGAISTVAGTLGAAGNEGDLGAAADAHLRTPNGVALDHAGNLYIADSGNNRIRRVGAADGRIRRFAGDPTGASFAYNGDGISADGAYLNFPFDVAVDKGDKVYIADFLSNRVRRVDPATGVIATVAGTGAAGAAGDGGAGVAATLSLPIGLAFDADGNLYIADSLNERIRVLAPGGGIRTVAGIGAAADAGDNGPAVQAYLSGPRAVATDPSGVVYIADQDNFRVRVLRPQVTSIRAVSNAASNVGGAVAPGEIVALYGALLGPPAGAYGQVTGGKFDTSAGGVRVLFDGVAAPVLYAGATQVNAIVPYGVQGTTSIQVEASGKLSTPLIVPVAAAAPGIFTAAGTGSGQALAANGDGTRNGAAAPAARGSVVVLYVTGEGLTNPAGVDGQIAVEAPWPAPLLKVTVGIGGVPATVLYAGAAPYQTSGVMQVNALVPAAVTPGASVPVTVTVGSFVSPAGVTIAVK